MHERPFRARLEREFHARRQKNPRFSLRAFAALLETDHSTLSQILRGTRRVPVSRMRAWGKKLRMDPEEVAAYVAAEHAPDASTVEREELLRHWSAEAMSIVTERAHWEIVRLSRSAGFRADSRWVAKQIGASVDEVNLAVSRLLRLRLLAMGPNGEWRDMTRLAVVTEREFRRIALARVREKAAESKVELGRTRR